MQESRVVQILVSSNQCPGGGFGLQYGFKVLHENAQGKDFKRNIFKDMVHGVRVGLKLGIKFYLIHGYRGI